MIERPERIVDPEDWAELVQATRDLQKAQRRYDAVRARIADAYDIEPHEAIDPATRRVVPMPQARGQG